MSSGFGEIDRQIREHTAARAIEHLNAALDKPLRPETKSVISRFAQVLSTIDDIARREDSGKSVSEDQADSVNRFLASYPVVRKLVIREGRIVEKFLNKPTSISDKIGQELASLLFEMEKSGALMRVQRCDKCFHWFYVKRLRTLKPDDKAFCSDNCRKSEWQKDYFRHHLSVNQKLYRQGLEPDEVRKLRKTRKKR